VSQVVPAGFPQPAFLIDRLSYRPKALRVERPVGAVGVHAYDNGQTDEGKLFAWYGGAYLSNQKV
jgi:hypothetical protein